MNCFRFVSLKYWTQLATQYISVMISCELLSICIFEILNTTITGPSLAHYVLWIAFDLYLWNIEHNHFQFGSVLFTVVNCFRFVSLKYWTQRLLWYTLLYYRCELLSICIFEILNTTKLLFIPTYRELWIAFDLYLWNIEHNHFFVIFTFSSVVNCFRFVSLKYWTQRPGPGWRVPTGCELLSICIFEILNTTLQQFTADLYALWIAFDLYLWNIEHNTSYFVDTLTAVVNCFRFVSLKYWTQPPIKNGR